MSGIINKVKDALHHDKTDTTHSSTTQSGAGSSGVTGSHNTSNALSGSTNHGPYDSNAANKLDPRIDSDRDGRAAHGTGLGSNTHSGVGSNTHSTGLGSNTHSTGYGSSNTHSSGLGSSKTHSVAGSGYGSSNTTAGPHSSNLLNKADPRLDSTNAGPHDSNALNKADPRVDSDLDGKGNRHGANTGGVLGAHGSHATAGSGTAQNTAGPHNSDMLNKLDPRVDSDRDGSKTYGGNATHR